jgi:FAD/FMN-containing dehydrogenase
MNPSANTVFLRNRSTEFPDYVGRRERLVRELAEAAASGANLRLRKDTSNLFRHRTNAPGQRVDVRNFNHVLAVDPEAQVADVEGMTTYQEFVDQTLKFGLLPTVVPQLKTITVGGAVSGLGIESSSFRYGLVHETVEEMEILLGDGTTLVCSVEQNPDLFYGFPNSYGTLGYALRLRVKLIPAGKYVRLMHRKFTNHERLFAALEALCGDATFNYVDGVVFGPGEAYLTTGEFVDTAHVSDYTYMRMYYQSIRSREEDFLSARDYIWRWDTDWFWCSRHFFVQNTLVRLLATRRLLNSRTYQRIMRLSHRILPNSNTESVIQDVDIPIEHAPEFLDFLFREIGILPIWLCPFRSYDPSVGFTLCGLDSHKLYVNFGFWDMLPKAGEDGFYNRKIEKKAFELNGKKGLYSSSYYDEETFWRIYDREAYRRLKTKYDPTNRLRDLYEKTVLKM